MPRHLGIDIGTTSVKAAVVRSAYRKLVLEGLAEAPLGADRSDVAVQAAIREAAQAALGAGAADGVAASLPGTQATLRTVRIPETAAQKLADVLPFELESHLPFDLENAVLDWRVLDGHTNEDGLAVLAVVAQVEDARRRVELVHAALGLEPERLGSGAFPVANLAPLATLLSESRGVALVDFGNKTSDLVVLEAGEPVFARTLSLGTEGLPGTAAKLAREVRLSLAAFRAQGGKAPDEVYLCGGGAFVSGAESFLAAELELPVHRLPALSIELGERVTHAAGLAAPGPARLGDAQSLPLYASALGLAMSLAARDRGVNLRKGPLAYERGFGWLRERVPVLAGLGAVILVSFVFSAVTALYAASKERGALEAALGDVTGQVFGDADATTSAARAKELLASEGATEEDPLPHADAFDVMVRLSEHVPQSMTHDVEELDVQKGHVVIHGIVGTITEVQSLVTSLATEKCFADVKNTRNSQVIGGERQKYVIEFDLKCPEDVKPTKKKKTEASSSSSAASSARSGGA